MSVLNSAHKLTIAILLSFVVALSLGQSVEAQGKPGANFKWVYVFDSTGASPEGELLVTIYDQTCSSEINNYVFPSKCTVNADHIACEVNIQDAANQALYQEGFTPFAPAAQSYPAIFTEVYGSFKSHKASIRDSIIEHPSLTFGLETSGAGTAHYMTNWSGTQTASSDFAFTPHTPHIMHTGLGGSKFSHMVDHKTIDTDSGPAMLPFLINRTTFEFYQPNDFKLDGAIVDPGTCGFG